MSTDFSLNLVQGDNVITLTWLNLTSYSITSTDILTVIINDTDASTDVSSTFIRSFSYTGDASRNSILLGSDKLTLGKTYNILMEIKKSSDNTTLVSNSKVAKFICAPVAPLFNVITSDNAFYFSITNYSLLSTSPNFGNDGYTKITAYDIYVSEVNNTADGMRKISVLQSVDGSSNPIYNSQYLVEASGNSLSGFFLNGRTYELAIRSKNAVSTSQFGLTTIITPNDTPNVIPKVYAISQLPYNTIKSSNTTTPTGQIVVIIDKPTDFDTLRTASNGVGKVTSINISEQEYDASNNKLGSTTDYPFNVIYDASGNCTNLVTERLVVDSSTNLLTGFSTLDSSGNVPNVFRYTIPSSTGRLGKRYKYTATATNIYGSGPVSSETSSFSIPNTLPDKQVFTLTSRSLLQGGIATYDGSFNLNVTSLSSINGSNVDPSGNLSLTINRIDASNTLVSENIFNPDASGNYLINNLTELGTKHSFTLKRISKDPQISRFRYESTSEIIIKTPFKNPIAPTDVEAYPVDVSQNFIIPFRLPDGSAGIIVKGSQISLGQFNGSNIPDSSGNVTAYYRLYRNSSPVDSVPTFPHNFLDPSGVITFNVAASIGLSNSYYIRTFVVNGEVSDPSNNVIGSPDSSPNRLATAINYLPAVTTLNVTPFDASSATITWTSQDNNSTLIPTADWTSRNRIIIRDASTNLPPMDASNVSLTTNSFFVSGLTPGRAYIAFVVAEGVYSKRRWDSSGNNTLLYNSAIMRQNLQRFVWISFSAPSAPTNIEAYPSSGRADLYWDPPLFSNGTNMTNTAYKIYLGSGATDASASAALTTNVNTDNWSRYLIDASAGSTYDTLTGLSNGTLYYYAIRAISKIGGQSILTNYTITDPSSANLFATATSPTIISDVFGSASTSDASRSFVPTNNVNTPILTTTNAASLIVGNVVKDGTATELVLILQNNDAVLDPSNSLVDPSYNTSGFTMFDSKNYANGSLTGLSHLINSANSNGGIATLNPKFSFSAANQGLISYKFDNIPNGVSQKITAYWSIEIGLRRIYSAAAIAFDTAIDAPSVVPSTSFSVDSSSILLGWDTPLNGGGAGTPGYGQLMYKLDITDPSGTSTIDNVVGNTYTLSNVRNGQNYKALIYPYFVNSNTFNQTVRSTKTAFNPDLSGNPQNIIPNPKPNGPTITANPVINNLPGNNKFLLNVSSPGAPEATNYPLTKYEVYISSSGQSERKILDISANINNSAAYLTTTTITTDGSTNLVNGTQYNLRVKTIGNYTYAQNAPDKTTSVVPFGDLIIQNIAKNTGSDAKTYTISYNKNGGNLLNQVVGIFNDVSGNRLVQTQVLSTANNNLPTMNPIGGEIFSFVTPPITTASSDAMFVLSNNTNSINTVAIGFNPSNSGNFGR